MSRYITLGYEVDDDGRETRVPFEVPRQELAAGHVHIRGRTRSGKSSLLLLSLILQIIETSESQAMQESVLVIDLGGDQGLFHATRTAAMAAGRRFRFVALDQDPEVDWDYFDPFEFLSAQGPTKQAMALLEALNLDPGPNSDKAYFALQNLMAVKTALHTLTAEGKAPTIETLAERLDMRTFRDAQQIWMALQLLAEFPQFSPPEGADPDRILSFSRALEHGEMVYIFAPTMNEATTARALAGLALRNAIQAATERTKRGLAPRFLWAFADEFQEVAGKGFAAVLAQSGKFNVSVLMANQTTDQLADHGSNLASVVRDNSHLKIYFTVVGKADFDELQNYSGDVIDTLEGWSAGFHGTNINASARKDFELSRDDILDTSSTFGHAFVIFDDGQGYSPPRRIWMSHRISPEVFGDIKRRPLPRRQKPRTLAAPTDSRPTTFVTETSDATNTDTVVSKAAMTLPALARLIERKRSAEGFEEPTIP